MVILTFEAKKELSNYQSKHYDKHYVHQEPKYNTINIIYFNILMTYTRHLPDGSPRPRGSPGDTAACF